ncbi:MAG: tannase/feruloyl esterase family alpha/beta hydrolase [Pseudomonadota bacterium]
MRSIVLRSNPFHYAALTLTLGLAGCGGGTGGAPESAPAARLLAQTVVSFPNTCASIEGMSIGSAAIALPTHGAVVDTATFHSSTEAGNPYGAYCELRGHIKSVDLTAPDIYFAVNLPNNWNSKAIHFGGSGFDGHVIDGTEQVRLSGSNSVPPLTQGYATYGDDSGHQAEEITDGSFAMNDEALANFGRNALKKTHDVAYVLMNARYGEGASKAYFLGTSTGGRDALTYLQHWPADYDGAIVNQPALNYTATRMSNVAIGRALYRNGGAGWINLAKTLLVQQTVLATCDTLDGVADGVISNVEGCRMRNEQILAALRCSDGSDLGDSCLSDAQIDTVRVVEAPMELRNFTLANGVVRNSGYNFLEGSQIANGDRHFGTRAVPSTPPTKDVDASLYFTGDQWARYFIARNAAFDSLNLDPVNPGSYQARIQTVSALTDASNPDLGAFFAHGGKLILVHGLADEVISTNGTIAYYQRMLDTVGASTVAANVRFYTVPGMGHGSGVFKPSWDSLGALEAWVENATPPANPVVVDTASATKGRSRPLCEYPGWPKYSGSGSVNSAASYSCSQAPDPAPACDNLPGSVTTFRGGDIWGEELNVTVDPATLAYSINVKASLQRSAGTVRSGTLQARGACTYASGENGATFTFGAGGVVQGAVAAPSGNKFLPFVAFGSTTGDYLALANIHNASGTQGDGASGLNAWNGVLRFRSSAPTWQTCQASGGGFIVYDANCANTTKGYIAYNATRAAFDLYTTPSTGAAVTTGGTLAGSVIGGVVNGTVVPLVLMRNSATSYGLRMLAPQASLSTGAGDGSYASIASSGINSALNVAGSVAHGAASQGTLAYNNPVAGVVTSSGGYAGALLFNAGIYGFSTGGYFELGVKR